MDNEQKALVQQTFAVVLTIEETAAALFYGRLFEIDPSLQPMFKGDIKAQGQKLMATLRVAVLGLDRLDKLLPVVQALGQRHVGYGVKDADYGTVAEALLWTLEKGLGDAFTPAVKQAWIEVYTLLAGVMKDAAGRKVAAQARVALAPAGLLPMSQRMPVSQRMPASVLPVSKREPLV
jgi:hemoglobin-like flavoprotein